MKNTKEDEAQKLPLGKENNKQINKRRKKKRIFASYLTQNITISFLLLRNAIVHVKDITVVQFKRKFHYIYKKIKELRKLELRVNP